ncbi:MAG: arginine decarboxylase [Firmicutes bacterium]|nr:arginine decarboxylase [Bacillota bacterium]
MHEAKYQLDQSRAPFLEGLVGYSTEGVIPFHTPGHKQGRRVDSELKDALGFNPFLLDVSDEIFAPDKANDSAAVLREAEALAADAFGAKRSFFLHNGTTAGIQAMLLASSWQFEHGRGDLPKDRPGEVVLPRSVHRSVFGGLVLAGLTPRFVRESWDHTWSIPLPPSPEAWQEAIGEGKGLAAVFDTYPSYYGMGGAVGKTAHLARGVDRPLLVDEAHGAHFRFHPGFPPTALSAGAAAVAQSAHKTLGVLTQASLLHTMDPGFAELMPTVLALLQSTSPSFLLYASLDAGRRQMALDGLELWQRALELAQEARNRINQIPGLLCLGSEVLEKPGVEFWDPTKLLIRVDGLGLSGPESEQRLRQYGIQVELSGLNHILVLITIGDGPEEVNGLVEALRKLASSTEQDAREKMAPLEMPVSGEMLLSPRSAMLSARRQVPFAKAEEEISAGTVTPYPPGIPLLVPGEKITGASLGCLESYWRQGIEIRGWANLGRKTIWVVDDH